VPVRLFLEKGVDDPHGNAAMLIDQAGARPQVPGYETALSRHRQSGSRIVSAPFRRTRLARIAWRAAIPFPTVIRVLSHSGLEQCLSMFAPCLLGHPGTTRYPHQGADLLIRGFRVQAFGGAPGGLHISMSALFTFAPSLRHCG
jgi:hypothetical protein